MLHWGDAKAMNSPMPRGTSRLGIGLSAAGVALALLALLFGDNLFERFPRGSEPGSAQKPFAALPGPDAPEAISRMGQGRWPLTGAGLAWRDGGRLVEPECFEREWLSSDNFKAFEEAFSIADPNDFRRNTGQYFGREINRVDPIDAPWGTDTVRLAAFPPCQLEDDEVINSFLVERSPVAIIGDDVAVKYCGASGNCMGFAYRLLAPIPQAACQTLAPRMVGRCESAYLIQIADAHSGTMKSRITFHIYGLFALNDGRRAMVPLVNFDNENDARNFTGNLLR